MYCGNLIATLKESTTSVVPVLVLIELTIFSLPEIQFGQYLVQRVILERINPPDLIPGL